MTENTPNHATRDAHRNRATPLPSGLRPTYGKSWAVVIGINGYRYIPRLQYAVEDAVGVAKLLVDSLGFSKEHILAVLDPSPEIADPPYRLVSKRAKKTAIEELLFDRLPETAEIDDRILIFYAGHGESRKLPTGKEKGYLVPADARLGAWHTYIEMDDVLEAGSFYQAKHVFYLLDACFSGLAVARSSASPARYHADMLTSRARQVLTAGTARQAVADRGPGEHSLFTTYVLQGLQGDAAQKGSPVITASDLMVYVKNRVGQDMGSQQTPDFGTLPGHESGGDFLFTLPRRAQPAPDLSQWVTIRDTHSYEGAAVAVCTAMETCLAMQGKQIHLDADELYNRAKKHDEMANAQGTYLETIVYVATFFGVGLKQEPPGTAQENYRARFIALASLDEIPGHLAEGRPVVAGCNILQGFYDAAKDGVIPAPAKRDALLGSMGITIVKYDPDEKMMTFAHNWGKTWGNQGVGMMSLAVAKILLHADRLWAVSVKGN